MDALYRPHGHSESGGVGPGGVELTPSSPTEARPADGAERTPPLVGKRMASQIPTDLEAASWTEERLFHHFKTDPAKGLTSMQVKESLHAHGPNRMRPRRPTPAWAKYLGQFANFFSILLVVASLLCFVSYAIEQGDDHANLYLGYVLLGVVVVTATFAYFQESRSERIMEGFKRLVPARCHVVRDGVDYVVDAHEVVPGDVVELADGDRVPADVRIISANDLMVDNSSLTGEAEPVERVPEEAGGGYMEARNLCFATTMVTAGVGRGVVIATGDNTVMGHIASSTLDTKPLASPLAVEIAEFVRETAALAIAMGVVFFLLSLAIGEGIIHTVVFALGAIVANVPEGLMPAVTVSLALAAKRMHAKSVLVKNLDSVETLGSVTVIASDKTGTLTQNRMTVQHCWYDLETHGAPPIRNLAERDYLAGSRSSSLGAPNVGASDAAFERLRLVATLCNNSNFFTTKDIRRELANPAFDLLRLDCSGDASEQGLLRFVEPYGSARDLRSANPKLFEIKFNAVNKWQLSIHGQGKGDGPGDAPPPPLLVMKGAPERVLARCARILVRGEERELTPELRAAVDGAVRDLGGLGERVLGFASAALDGFAPSFAFAGKPSPNFPADNLTFVGLISLMDPPRRGVPEAVARCRRARIKVLMVTGDHPVTAAAIARQVGILEPGDMEAGQGAVITGEEIRAWAADGDTKAREARWNEALRSNQLVFARVAPAQKLEIVEQCQRLGHIVAVTGDGVNDAPALKRANIGISMGIAGKDVSKEAADMILMDDNFSSIVNGVEEGRLIFENLKKTICYALTVNIPELLPFACTVLLKIPTPISTALMLALCLGTDMLPAISLAYEPKEADIMERPPRNARTDHLVSGRLVSHAYLLMGVLQTFAGFLAYLTVLNDYGYPPRILLNKLDFDSKPLLCLVDGNNEPTRCGFGCDGPDYPRGLPSATKYCKDGCAIPLPGQPVDPFGEMDYNGFRGARFCSLTCRSPPALFAAGALPAQCQSAELEGKIGFPGRKYISPHGPVGGFYWWGGRRQVMPNHKYQKEALKYAQTAYFVAVVLTQWANLIVCKTRGLSVFKQGMRNGVLNFSLVFETLVTAALLYVPFLQRIFGVRPLNALYWLLPIPFTLSILFVGEMRKLLTRRSPGGWLERWTYW